MQNYDEAIANIQLGNVKATHKPATLLVTAGSGCNIRCKFCYNVNMNYNPDPKNILRIMDQVHETLAVAHITGGEPLITKSGRAVLTKIAEGNYKFAVSLGTNAQFTDFNLLRPINLTRVQISTDAATKKVYEVVRVGGDFDDLITNIKKFVELKNEKPYMKVSTNYTVTSDNYVDLPEACKLYESMGLDTLFNLVMREKDDPQNIKERVDLYEPFLEKIEEALSIVISPFTKERLLYLKSVIMNRLNQYNSLPEKLKRKFQKRQ